MKNIKKNFVFLILIFLIFLNILAWIVVFDLNKHRFLEVNFFDVGQGDAIFIETPQRHQILIDGGPTAVILEKLAKEMPFWDRNIDLIILTHPEKDHLTGLLEVLKRYKVDYILWTGAVRDTFKYKEWQKLIESEKEKGTKLLIAQAGQKITSPSLVMEILFPLENLEGKIVKNSNNTSIVTKLNFGKKSFLFTGDITKSIERKLIESEASLNSDVLKVSHHGSKTSSSEEFIKEVSPEIAVIQVGENRYGHPHQEVLERLEKFGINILRTDLNGDIKILCDFQSLKLKQKK